MPKKELPLISVVIPVYNEEKNIPIAYKAVRELFDGLKHKYRLELFFSDNHSTDNTEFELIKLAEKDPDVKVIRLARNYGFQRSILTSYRLVNGDAAIQLDCDLQDPVGVIPEFLKLWEKGHDVVVGIRKKRPEPWALQASRKLFYRIVSSISDENIIENAGDFRLVDRSVLNRMALINDARPYTRGIISSLAANQTGVEFDRVARMYDESKFPVRKLIGFASDGIVSHSLVPLRLAIYAGVTICILALALLLYYVALYFISGDDWPAGFATLVVLMLFSMGFNAIFIGVVGEYVGRIFDQVRERPLSIIEKKLNLPDNKDSQTSKSKNR